MGNDRFDFNQPKDEEPVVIGDLLGIDVSGDIKWLGTKAINEAIAKRICRKTPIEIEVEALRSEREEIISSIAETERQGSLFEELSITLTEVTYVLLDTEADLYEMQRRCDDQGLH